MNSSLKPIYVVGYHQSPFGKLGAMTVPEIVHKAIDGLAASATVSMDNVDVASVGSMLAPVLLEQTLLAGVVAMEPGLGGKSIETVENACATGGQAVLSVVNKLLLGDGEVGLALGFEKMRDADGKADGRLIGKALGTASHPDERPGKVFVFPHLFAEIMDAYMKTYGISEEELSHVAPTFYSHAAHNPYAQMKGVEMTSEKVLRIEGPNRYLVEGLPMKTFECSQITDGYAALLVATEQGLKRLGIPRNRAALLAGWSQVTDPLSTRARDILKAQGAHSAMRKAYAMAGVTPADLDVAEVHDCFGIMGALSVEVLGLADAGQGARYYKDGKARLGGGGVPINTSGGLMAKGHPVSATGIAMIGWNYWQLTGQVPPALQVPNPRVAASFNIGGPICASVTTVLKRLD